jgi:hypothetical protein
MVMIEAFAAALGVADSNAITITSITEGSVDLDGNAAPTGAPGSSEAGSQLVGLTALIKSGNIAGMDVGSSTIIVEDGTVAEIPVEEEKSNVLAIVLGICIPIAVLSNFLFIFQSLSVLSFSSFTKRRLLKRCAILILKRKEETMVYSTIPTTRSLTDRFDFEHSLFILSTPIFSLYPFLWYFKDLIIKNH